MAEKTSNSLTLTWDPPANESQNGVIRQYVMQILEADTGITTTYYSNITQLTVINLHPHYTYKCSLAAETVAVGPHTTILTVQLDEDSKPSYIHICARATLPPYRSYCSSSQFHWFFSILHFH